MKVQRLTPTIRESIRLMLVDSFADSTERWLVWGCQHCDAIEHVANKYSFDVWDDIIIPAKRKRGDTFNNAGAY